MVLIAGCASSKVTDQQQLVTERIPRPDHILVYDFVATPDEVPTGSTLAGHSAVRRTTQTAEHKATGRRVGAEIAKQLFAEIRNMGMPAERASSRSTPQINDIVVRGYLLSVDEGSAAKRVTIDFGSGTSHLKVAVEGYQMTARGGCASSDLARWIPAEARDRAVLCRSPWRLPVAIRWVSS